MAAAAAAPALMDELIEDCLLRLPPDDPANLVRAALVCKGWLRIVTDRGFGRQFRELHGRPLLLGFLHIHTRYRPLFTPMSSFCSPRDVTSYLRIGGWHAIDLRHGRVLLSSSPSLYGTSSTRRRVDLAVWDPVSGDHVDLPELPPLSQQHWFGFTSKAAVLCRLCASSSACGCHRGHFLVVLMDVTYDKVDVYVYSPQAGAWSHQTSAAQDRRHLIPLSRQPVTMTGNALYFIVRKWRTNGILRYDMGAHDLSWVDLPPVCSTQGCQILLTTTANGGLGIVRVEKNSRILLRLWSSTREAGPNGVLGWAPNGVIELETVLPANSGSISTVAFVHGLGAFFIRTENAGVFAVDLVSNRVRKLCGNSRVNYFVPYTSLGNPALTGEGSTAGMPSA